MGKFMNQSSPQEGFLNDRAVLPSSGRTITSSVVRNLGNALYVRLHELQLMARAGQGGIIRNLSRWEVPKRRASIWKLTISRVLTVTG
jgi:hypothetical protein